MQILAVFAAIAAVYTSGVSATCYGGGDTWASTGDANTKLIDACNELAGNYAPGQNRAVCRNADAPGLFGGDQKYDFQVHNQNNYAVFLSKDACVKNLRREIYNCSRGGYEVFGGAFCRYVDFAVGARGLEYAVADLRRADPNLGRC